ncbi:MAG: patatin-like phospholipase family protein [Acidobacteria bacterium]|nr:patatin-like phospholipase family protein [Acidobacteriota bacterium]
MIDHRPAALLVASIALLSGFALPVAAQQPPADPPAPTGVTPDPPAPPPPVQSVEPPRIAGRPKVGLVLSGGGARGAAHVGVLRVLRDLQIPIDYIAGTSMGSIVGGLYASGMSVEELEEVVDSTDWFDVFNDSSRRQNLSFRRKQDDAQVLSPIRIGLERGKAPFPLGLITGQKVGGMLRDFSITAAGIETFDDLPIPFAAVATDLATGEMVVLRRGSLSEAMRASMAVPGVFTPVEIDGRYLVDGGLVRNLPVDVVRAMGAEVVIAVDISTPLDSIAEIRTFFNVTGQMTGFQTRRNVLEQIETLGPHDVLIVPPLEGIRSGSFEPEKLKLAVASGEEATRARASALEPLRVSATDYAAFQKRHFRSTTRVVQVRDINISNDSRLDTRVLAARVKAKPNAPLDLTVLNADLARLYELDAFELVDFVLIPIPDESNLFDLLIRAKAKTWARNFVRFGLSLISDLTGYGEFTALGSYTMTQINGLGAEWKTYGAVGTRPLIETEFYQPIDFAGHWFVSAYGGWRRVPYPVANDEQIVLEFRLDRAAAGIDLGRQFGRWAELRIGAVAAWRDITLQTLDPGAVQLESNPLAARLSFEWDTLDNINFPRRGLKMLLVSQYAFDGGVDDESFQTAELNAGGAVSFGRNTIAPGLRAGWAGGAPTVFDQYSFGGLFNLSGYGVQRYFGTKAVLGKLAYYRRVLELPAQVGTGIYVGCGVEGAWSEDPVEGEPTDGWKGAAAAWVGADTLIGPLYMAYGISSDGIDSFYLFLGRLF